MRWLRLLMMLVLLSGPALAVQPDEVLSDPALETRARELSRELRCMVCQNQSIDDSNAPLAKDLRVLVRERITAGDTDGQVKAFLTERYGDFVLLRPPFDWRTVLPWTAPFLILVAGLIMAMRRRRAAGAEPPLTPEEQQSLDEILQGDTQGADRPADPAVDAGGEAGKLTKA